MQVGETSDSYTFWGFVGCFEYLAKGIVHQREIRKKKGGSEWWIEDTVFNKPAHLPVRQLWHPNGDSFSITVQNKEGEVVQVEKEAGWMSRYYGVKQPAEMLVAQTKDEQLTAHIVA
jgi:hypothetical protein